MRKIALTPEEHRALGERLKRIRTDLLIAFDKIQPAYPKASRPMKRLQAAIRELDAVRCYLDDEVCRQFPDQKPERIYFGSP